jgi:phospholipase C
MSRIVHWIGKLSPALLASTVVAGTLAASLVVSATVSHAAITRPNPIRHVVVIYMENHSFDNVLGKLCVVDDRCNGVTRGKLLSGKQKTLTQARDIVVKMDHSVTAQRRAMNGGRMNGFPLIPACKADTGYACYTQYNPGQIPNLAALARQFAINDRTFSMDPIPSWGAHLELVAAQLDGFTGQLPVESTTGATPHHGWGCDSNKDAPWQASPSAPVQMVPSCVPDFDLNPAVHPYGGAYRPTPVDYVPTIMDRMSASGRTWKIYASEGPGPGTYGWAICPTFAECFYTEQRNRWVQSGEVVPNAENGKLPNLSIVIPEGPNSQHNDNSMLQGDNWLGNVVGAIQSGPDWKSTAIFITYDDCGCFYDHVAPPVQGWGIRVPMVIVSPYAKRHFTESRPTTFVSMLTFTEHVFGLRPLSTLDASAYDYAGSFNFKRAALRRTNLTHSPLSPHKRRYLKAHPADEDDPT